MDQQLGKAYKLCSRKRIQLVFQEGKTIRTYPLACTYRKVHVASDVPFQLVISAPKRLFKKAHDRNYVKRLMKESIRQNKLPLVSFLSANQLQLDLFIVYTSKDLLSLDRLSTSIHKLFKALIHDLEKIEHQSKNA